MNNTLKGKILVIKETQVITESFSKREFVISDTSGMYEQEILFQVIKDKCAELDSYKVGDEIEVSYNLLGRSWTSPQGEVKYFNTLDAWRIEKSGGIAGQYTERQDGIRPIATPEGYHGDDVSF